GRWLTLDEALHAAMRKRGHRVEERAGATHVRLRPGLRYESRRDLNQTALNVEVAYWNLVGSRWTLYSREVGLDLARRALATAERIGAPRVQLLQARGQVDLFIAQRCQAEDSHEENERQLRVLTGMAYDGSRLIPVDAPPARGFPPDWNAALVEARTKRPELLAWRAAVTFWQPVAEGEAAVRRWLRLPAGDGMKGSWTTDTRGYLANALETLRDQELKAESFLYLYFRRRSTAVEQIKANRAQQVAFGEQARAREREYGGGRGDMDILLESQRFWADALACEHQAIATYANSVAGFAFARGTATRGFVIDDVP
ncbi:MAG: hypothetical protein ACRC33_03810, partial [Gemmataceae bacterium]